MFFQDLNDCAVSANGDVSLETKRVSDVRCRQIRETDLEAVVALLGAGFPARTSETWRRGLQRLRDRVLPDGFSRYGVVLEAEGRLVGVLLLIFSRIDDADPPAMRCYFSSWYVEPAFSAYSNVLVWHALKTKNTTCINISPAPHTLKTIEAQGFRPFRCGWHLTLPWLQRRRETARVRCLAPGAADLASWPDRVLIEEHLAFGCLCLVVEAEHGAHPFVFTTGRRLRGFLPASTLIYCRDIAAFARFAGPIGRALLRRGILAVLLDEGGADAAVPGRPISRSQPHYCKGPLPPRAGDLSYTELAIFDP